jgi:hypothetical protein
MCYTVSAVLNQRAGGERENTSHSASAAICQFHAHKVIFIRRGEGGGLCVVLITTSGGGAVTPLCAFAHDFHLAQPLVLPVTLLYDQFRGHSFFGGKERRKDELQDRGGKGLLPLLK